EARQDSRLPPRPSEGNKGSMGLTSLLVRLSNPRDRRRAVEKELLVDSGAIYAVVPAPVLRRIGVRPSGKETFTLADGTHLTRRVGTPYSVTTKSTNVRGTVTTVPSASCATMRETVPARAVEGSTWIARPPRAKSAPIVQTSWPPGPVYMVAPIDSEATCPVRSI